MTQEEFEYWWKVIYQPTYVVTDARPSRNPSLRKTITINFPAIPEDIYEYIQENYGAFITLNFVYHGNNECRNKNGAYKINPSYYDEYRNSKMRFKNKNGITPKKPRWSILGFPGISGGLDLKGKKQGMVVDLSNIYNQPFTIQYTIEVGYSIRHQLNRWIRKKDHWINHIINQLHDIPSSYKPSKFKYYYAPCLHFGSDVELVFGLDLPKFLDLTYIEVDSTIIE